LDNGAWEPVEEILRLDNLVRARLGLPPRGGRIAQPWTDSDAAPVLATLPLRVSVRSDVDVERPALALEDADGVTIDLDGVRVRSDPTGWWVDEAIRTVPLAPLTAGRHELMLTVPFTRKTNVEACYLLGDFGVTVAGRDARITTPVRELPFGDWTSQGLPFYGGNVTYHCTIVGDGESEFHIEASKFTNPLLAVELDAWPVGKIAFAPFQLSLGVLPRREHRLDITAFGNRANTFGPLHNANENVTWIGPAAWRHTGANWSYEYQLTRAGILAAPIIRRLAR
jgi:hypothetical protein